MVSSAASTRLAAVLMTGGGEAEGKQLLAEARTRASVTGEAVAARSRGHGELFRARRERADREAERGRGLRDTGRGADDGRATGRGAAPRGASRFCASATWDRWRRRSSRSHRARSTGAASTAFWGVTSASSCWAFEA